MNKSFTHTSALAIASCSWPGDPEPFMALNMSHEKRVTVLSTLMEHVPGLQASPETSYEARIIYDTVVLKGPLQL